MGNRTLSRFSQHVPTRFVAFRTFDVGIADSKNGRQRLNSVKSIFVRLFLHVRTRCFAQVRMSIGSILDIDSSKRAFLRLIDSQKASLNRELREVGMSFFVFRRATIQLHQKCSSR